MQPKIELPGECKRGRAQDLHGESFRIEAGSTVQVKNALGLVDTELRKHKAHPCLSGGLLSRSLAISSIIRTQIAYVERALDRSLACA